MSSILDEIGHYKKSWVRSCKQQVNEQSLIDAGKYYQPLGFSAALSQRIQAKQNAVIAEIKKASPSKGIIREDFSPVTIGQQYQEAGACCLSILTDVQYFQGADQFVRDVRKHVSIPILRKEFIIDPYQILEARAMGADAILLILAMLDNHQLQDLAETANSLELTILPEVHNRYELDRTLEYLNTELIGINNRDLHTFSTHLSCTTDLLPHVPGDRTVITESGIAIYEDIKTMNNAGVYGFLVGESLMRQAHPGDALKKLIG
ncbi:MAG: indole-3-glycerol phosphate synthase TrpC [Zetaproteobacteria bacterium]|nr:indole-3-glycerol phosphate synthase TrpC [Zetaproteobacteria bacterium]